MFVKVRTGCNQSHSQVQGGHCEIGKDSDCDGKSLRLTAQDSPGWSVRSLIEYVSLVLPGCPLPETRSAYSYGDRSPV